MTPTPPEAALPGHTEKTFFGHPRALLILFFSEMWERFSFYGMRALLILYMTKALVYTDKRATGVYAAYGAIVYALPVIGGMLADRLLGYRRAIILGGVLMAIGHFVMAIPVEAALYPGLAFISLGNGFFKPNISSLVGKLYAEKDPRRDVGFTIFYMGINIGAFTAPLLCGLLAEYVDWHAGFGLAGIGMVLGLITFIRGRRHLQGYGEPPDLPRLERRSAAGISSGNTVVIGSLLAAPLVAAGLYWSRAGSHAVEAMALAILVYLLVTAFRSDRVTGQRLGALIILMFFHTAFWACFEQAGSSLNLFADRNVDRRLLVDGAGTAMFTIPTTWFQSANAGFLVLLAPFFALLWPALERRRLNPSTPLKFVLGLVQVGLGFGALVLGAQSAGSDGLVSLGWLVLAYLFHTTGELCLSPIGLSTVTKLSPAHVVGTVMGAWFLTISLGHVLAGAIATLMRIEAPEGQPAAAVPPTETLPVYAGVFEQVFHGALIAGVVLLLLSPLIRRLTHGVK